MTKIKRKQNTQPEPFDRKDTAEYVAGTVTHMHYTVGVENPPAFDKNDENLAALLMATCLTSDLNRNPDPHSIKTV